MKNFSKMLLTLLLLLLFVLPNNIYGQNKKQVNKGSKSNFLAPIKKKIKGMSINFAVSGKIEMNLPDFSDGRSVSVNVLSFEASEGAKHFIPWTDKDIKVECNGNKFSFSKTCAPDMFGNGGTINVYGTLSADGKTLEECFVQFIGTPSSRLPKNEEYYYNFTAKNIPWVNSNIGDRVYYIDNIQDKVQIFNEPHYYKKTILQDNSWRSEKYLTSEGAQPGDYFSLTFVYEK